jgi:hypothetical protein
MEMPAPVELTPLPEPLPNVFAIPEDEEFPATSRAGAKNP